MRKELTLAEIHEELTEQLRDIDAICRKHQIPYNLMCGTLLGSVRHQGFIPWDDDVDLLMTREAFTRFRQIYPQECDRRFELTYLDTWTPRVMNRDPEKAAAFTDLFILDPLPPEGIRRKMHLRHLHLLQVMMKKNVDYSRLSLKNRILLRVTHWMGMPFSYAWKARRYEAVSSRIREGRDLHMSNGAFELMTHVWHPEQFEKKIEGLFEGMSCLIPEKYDEVLTVLFGPDYMTPPPPEERVAKHLDI